MTPSTPFVDRNDGSIDTTQVLYEAIPLAKLIALFAMIGFVPFAIGYLLGSSGFALLFSVIAQFVFAVGAGIVLIYAVARGIQLSE